MHGSDSAVEVAQETASVAASTKEKMRQRRMMIQEPESVPDGEPPADVVLPTEVKP